MNRMNAKNLIENLLTHADITINGNKPWDIQVHNQKFYDRVLRNNSLGLGESYMEGWWDCAELDQLFDRLLRAKLENKIHINFWNKLRILFGRVFNLQTKAQSLIVGRKHYDLGNDLFRAMLDLRLNYTCAFWKDATDLDTAQLQKLDLCCQKLGLKPGMRLLDIGCGFGALAKYAAENYGVSVVGITISKEQYEFAKENCKNLPVEIRFQDYRDVNEIFDCVSSLGMFEHVGHLNYRTYIETVKKVLHDEGLFLLHTIGSNYTTTIADPWISKYIFPHGMLPSIAQIGHAIEKRFVMEDWHNFGADYDKTLKAWHHNFNAHWLTLQKQYDESFFRMWNYYLLSCAGGFRARDMQLWQIVLSKNGVSGGYPVSRPYFQVDAVSRNSAKTLDNTHLLWPRAESLV